ncbi:hypothetical protein GCM10017744_086520 [Streptomyces antimycoticus]|uniref:Uncharacterized protein n=1 Tax=Streptomyces antimycoticus TaxID=68175 RepID=A0A4D4JXG9_9ACTN|nr:hypothetical protein SANT12839_014860 [Streptomyces antimycoticus]
MTVAPAQVPDRSRDRRSWNGHRDRSTNARSTVRYTVRTAVVALPVAVLATDAIAFSPRLPKVKTEVFTFAPSQSR